MQTKAKSNFKTDIMNARKKPHIQEPTKTMKTKIKSITISLFAVLLVFAAYVSSASAQAPTMTFLVWPPSVPPGGSAKLAWITTNGTTCTASNGWSGSKALTGTQVITNITTATTYTLACTGPGGTTTQSANVTIGPAQGPTVPYLQGFETDTTGWFPYMFSTTPVVPLIARYASGDASSPLGALTAASGGYYGVLTKTLQDLETGFPCVMGSGAPMFFGRTGTQTDGWITPASFDPYPGPFTQAISIYIPTSGSNAWTPEATSTIAGLIINENPNSGGGHYNEETNMDFSVRTTGTVLVAMSNDYYYAPSSGLPLLATVTQSGWYTFTVTVLKAGNQTTDPFIGVWGAFDSSGHLLGSWTEPPNTNSGYGSSSLLSAGFLEIAAWQPGFANNHVAIDNVQSYVGFPNASSAPVITSSGVATATVGVPFTYTISATNSPTGFKSSTLPAGLSLAAGTGMITGTPTTVGTQYVTIIASNTTGVGGALLNITVNPSGSYTTVNDTGSGYTYTGSDWAYSANRGLGDYNNDVHYCTTNGSNVTFTFTGTGFDYISETNSDMGNVSISVDGGTATTVSAYSASRVAQVKLYSSTGLTSGSHTVKLTKISGGFMVVDAFNVYTSVSTTVNDTGSGYTYTGSDWVYSANRGLGDYNNDVHFCTTNGSNVTFAFTGTGFDYITETNSDMGNVSVSVDGGTATTVSAYTATRVAQVKLYSSTGLASGSHTVKLTKTGGGYMVVDAFNVYTNSGGLPSPWANQDIGAVGLAGSASYAGGVFTASGSGADIYGTADAFQYVYQPASGDCSITARVVTQQNTNTYAKAGVMIRETLAANSTYAFMQETPNGLYYQDRATTGGSAATVAGPVTGAVPYWVRVTRAGNVFTAYSSPDGTTWAQAGAAQTITMAANVYIGLPVCSHNTTTLSTVTFDNVTAVP